MTRTAASPETTGRGCILSWNFDFADLNGQRHAVSRPGFQAPHDRLTNVRQRLGLNAPLRETQPGTAGHSATIIPVSSVSR